MAKVNAIDKEAFVRGMSRTIGFRSKENVIRSQRLREWHGIAGSAMKGNSIASACGAEMERRFGNAHGPARGKAFKGCLISEGYAQLSNKLSEASGKIAAPKMEYRRAVLAR